MLIRDRIRELRRVQASQLRPNAKNWRTHPPEQQDALRGILAEVGYADALLARELPDGSLELVDGHLRAETTPDQVVPVLILDLTDAEADKLLASLDPLAALAEADAQKLDSLLREVDTGNEALQQMLADLADDAGLYRSDSTNSGEQVDPAEEWQGMPEFVHEDQTAHRTLYVHFKTEEDVQTFSRLVGQPVTDRTRYLWYPQQEIIRYGEAR